MENKVTSLTAIVKYVLQHITQMNTKSRKMGRKKEYDENENIIQKMKLKYEK